MLIKYRASYWLHKIFLLFIYITSSRKISFEVKYYTCYRMGLSSWPTKLFSAANLWHRGSRNLMASLNASLKIKTELEHPEFTLLVGSFCPHETVVPGSFLWAWSGERFSFQNSPFFQPFSLERCHPQRRTAWCAHRQRWPPPVKYFSGDPQLLSMMLLLEGRTMVLNRPCLMDRVWWGLVTQPGKGPFS